MFFAEVNTVGVSCVETSLAKLAGVTNCWIHEMFGLKVTEHFVTARGSKRTHIAHKFSGNEWIFGYVHFDFLFPLRYVIYNQYQLSTKRSSPKINTHQIFNFKAEKTGTRLEGYHLA